MSTYTINHETLFQSFMIGAKNVIAEKNHLNEINVFPVADGDTGTNLSNMMHSILQNGRKGATLSETIRSIAEAAIMGARGNSGIIFAQYIIGFSESITEDEVNHETLSLSAQKGFDYAYHAIATPVEGTMITVMRTWSNAIKQFKHATSNTLELLNQAYEATKDELAKTKDKLEVLKQNKVVDAGAKGFVRFVEGFLQALKGEKADIAIEETVDIDKPIHVIADRPNIHRYCTEALIKGNHLDLDAIRHQMMSLGDSVVVAGSKTTARIHLHTGHPDEAIAQLAQLGHIVEQKADDMLRQYQSINDRKYPIALVTDSIADLPQSMIDQYQIHQFPINLLINDSQYLDKVTIRSERFYTMMDTLETYPKSSQPNLIDLKNFFSTLVGHYSEILVITVSSKMSGTHQVFEQVAKSFPNTTIRVIDSKQNSGAEGLLVLKAAELIDQGWALEKISSYIEDTIKRTKILVSVQTLKYMIRSGRVSKTKGLLAKIMNLKPVVSIDEDGNGIIADKGFSIKMSNQKIYRHVEKVHQEQGIQAYAIVHANAADRALEYETMYTKLMGKAPLYVMDISTIVAMSAGIGTVAIAYIKGNPS